MINYLVSRFHLEFYCLSGTSIEVSCHVSVSLGENILHADFAKANDSYIAQVA